MPEKIETERIVLSEGTMARRWKFILEEACVAKTGPDALVIFFVFLAIVGALTIAACVAR